MVKNKRHQEGFVSLLGLLLVLVIIGFVFYKAYGVYFGKPAIDKETEKVLSKEGIDTTSQQAVLETTKEKIKSVEKLMLEREDQLFNVVGQ